MLAFMEFTFSCSEFDSKWINVCYVMVTNAKKKNKVESLFLIPSNFLWIHLFAFFLPLVELLFQCTFGMMWWTHTKGSIRNNFTEVIYRRKTGHKFTSNWFLQYKKFIYQILIWYFICARHCSICFIKMFSSNSHNGLMI